MNNADFSKKIRIISSFYVLLFVIFLYLCALAGNQRFILNGSLWLNNQQSSFCLFLFLRILFFRKNKNTLYAPQIHRSDYPHSILWIITFRLCRTAGWDCDLQQKIHVCSIRTMKISLFAIERK